MKKRVNWTNQQISHLQYIPTNNTNDNNEPLLDKSAISMSDFELLIFVMTTYNHEIKSRKKENLLLLTAHEI